LAGKVFIVVEDTYARYALERVLKRHSVNLSKVEIRHLAICSSKMSRIIGAHIRAGNHVIIIADAEREPRVQREQWVRQRHGLGSQVDIIVVDPCMEAPACEALGLRGCRGKPCGDGPLQAVNTYWRRRHGRDYDKRFLPSLLLEADEKGSLSNVLEFNRLLRIIAAKTSESG